MLLRDRIAQIEELKTPAYIYDLKRLNKIVSAAKNESEAYGYHVHYALKANTHPAVLAAMVEAGFGADCVSGEEVDAALQAGFAPEKIAFAGVGKRDDEIELGLREGIFSFNVESVEELKVIAEIAAKMEKVARVALRLNPDVNANTHKYITTGLEENKFGINVWELDRVFEVLNASDGLKLVGLHFHIGSQILDLSSFRNLCLKVNEIQSRFIERGVIVDHINVGGGLGIDYNQPDERLVPDFANYFRIFNEFLELRPSQQVHFELGRSLVANAGDLLAKVLYVKEGVKTNFAILDAGMTELIRPALYQAYHKIENVSSREQKMSKYDVVGPVCESSDSFGKAVEMPTTKRGDYIAIRSVGAYGEVMQMGYNLRKPATVYILE